MDYIKKVKNIKWLLDKPPISITQMEIVEPCIYCGEVIGGLIRYDGADFCICHQCLKKAFDKILNNQEKEVE